MDEEGSLEMRNCFKSFLSVVDAVTYGYIEDVEVRMEEGCLCHLPCDDIMRLWLRAMYGIVIDARLGFGGFWAFIGTLGTNETFRPSEP